MAAVLVGAFLAASSAAGTDAVPGFESRKPGSEPELRYWLQNMVWEHGFSLEEIRAATGLAGAEITAALRRFDIRPETKPPRTRDARLRLVPWPGGRAVSNWGGTVEPSRQRETKASVFAPWDEMSYVVLDVPEAIFSSLGIQYLAHLDVPTIWTRKGVVLEKLEWNRRDDGLDISRRLPNGVAYSARMIAGMDAILMKLVLTNDAGASLSDLRIQNCVFLKGMRGMENEANPRVVSRAPYTAYGTAAGLRWVIVAWTPCDRIWNNPKNPCFHSDPKFPDCPAGESRSVYGRLSFYEGADIQGELDRIEKTGWDLALAGSDPISGVAKSSRYGAVREDFLLGPGKNKGFVIYRPDVTPAGGTRPWIFYAPTFVEPDGYPDDGHAWLFKRLLAEGFSIAGVDVGESFGNPAGRAVYAEFHRAVTSRYGLAARACLLPQSRGGLMLYNWAAEHPECVQCVGGIYTVCDQSSWPGLAVSCAAYGMSEPGLTAVLKDHNPIDRLEPLARAGIAILHVHGDADTLVPLDRNSAELVRRYKALGGDATLVVIKGKGHRVEPEFFENPRLLEFFLLQGAASLRPRL